MIHFPEVILMNEMIPAAQVPKGRRVVAGDVDIDELVRVISPENLQKGLVESGERGAEHSSW